MSRLIEYPWIESPAARFWLGVTVPVPLAAVSTVIEVAAAGSICRAASSVLVRYSPVTVWAPETVEPQLARAQLPSGVIEKVVSPVTSPRELPYTSNASDV